jgi:hypothetical protein
MQNSKLSTIIFPRLNDSWQHFIQKVNEELANDISADRNNLKRRNELKYAIPKIKEAKEESKGNIAEILKYRDAFVVADNSLSTLFDAIEFFKNVDNLDNDAVNTLYQQIISSPVILGLGDEYNGILLKQESHKKTIKPLEDLVNGKKFDQELIKKLLDKYNFNDKTKKDVLFYVLVMSTVKQNTVKKTPITRVDRKAEKQRLQREKLKELCELYNEKLETYKDLLAYCYNLREKMSAADKVMYQGYTAYAIDTNLKEEYGFNDDELLKIYALQLIGEKNDLEEYISGLSDIQMDNVDLSSEIAFLQEFLNEFDELVKKVGEFSKDNEQVIEDEENVENTRVFFAHDPWQRLIVNPKLISSNKNGLNAFIRKVNSSSNYKIDGVNANQMLGVDLAEKAIGKTIYIYSATNYKLAYAKVKDSVLVLGIADANDTKFDSTLNSIVRGGCEAIKRQISIIESGDIRKEEYIELQKNLVSELLNEENKTK